LRRKFVITSTNVDHVRQVAGSDERVIEIVGKPYDLGELTDGGEAGRSSAF
jgi:NAD-dependent SIR2 family protein deacetylase